MKDNKRINRKSGMQWMGIIAACFVCGGVFAVTALSPENTQNQNSASTEYADFESADNVGFENTETLETEGTEQVTTESAESLVDETTESPESGIAEEIPPYAGTAYVTANQNQPYFTAEELATAVTSFESYAPLDELGRCGTCIASVGPDLMPTEERGAIGMIKPTGWHTVKYSDIIADHYLYNRCHLIGYQLTGENANEQNLITGTRYLNVEGMAPFENRVAEYVKSTGNHVLYRVTPVFEGDNLVASGVRIEAKSVEDEGTGVCFHVYCYNVQPGILIDYTDGSSRVDDCDEICDIQAEDESSAGNIIVPENIVTAAGQYAVNSKNGKIHMVGECPATGDGSQAMSSPVYFSTYEEAEGFSEQIAPNQQKRNCGNCW